MRRIVVLGAGAWGTALANLAGRAGATVALWSRDPHQADLLQSMRCNERRLPGIALHPGVAPTGDLASALEGADVVLLAVPAQEVRGLLERMGGHLAAGTPVVICAKGIERRSGKFLSEVVLELQPAATPAVLSGPSFAADVARGLPTAVTLAAHDEDVARDLAAALSAPWFRLYHSNDLRGVEIGGATKNVLAIASGIAGGKRLGESAKAALIARGFAELVRFGAAHGAQPGTLSGLSGLGDLVLTCGSAQSRNYSLGFALGCGQSLAEANEAVGTAEGAFTCSVLCRLAAEAGIDMPIAQAVDAILTGRASVDEAIGSLFNRPLRADVAATA